MGGIVGWRLLVPVDWNQDEGEIPMKVMLKQFDAGEGASYICHQ